MRSFEVVSGLHCTQAHVALYGSAGLDGSDPTGMEGRKGRVEDSLTLLKGGREV